MTALLLYATINRKIISLVRAQKFPHVGTKTGQTPNANYLQTMVLSGYRGFYIPLPPINQNQIQDENVISIFIDVDCTCGWC